MKGSFFNQSIEYKIFIDGESWKQGDRITGQGSIGFTQNTQNTNNEIKMADFLNFKVLLAKGDFKKIKKKDLKSFKVIESKTIKEIQKKSPQIENTLEVNFDFDFLLDKDCAISDSTGSLYLLLCKDMKNPFCGISLMLNIFPHNTITSFIQIFENFYRFKAKAFKNKKDFLEAKIGFPSSKELSSIQSLNLQVKMNDQILETAFHFKLKKVVFTGGIMGTEDYKLEIKKSLNPSDYQFEKNSPNQERICSIIKEVIDQVKLRPII